MSSVKLRCPNPGCHLVLEVPEEMFGQRVRCGGCGCSFIAPLGRAKPPNPRGRKPHARRAG